MRISFLETETTMTTDKNNSCPPGAPAPGFKSAVREYACREAIRLGERGMHLREAVRLPDE